MMCLRKPGKLPGPALPASTRVVQALRRYASSGPARELREGETPRYAGDKYTEWAYPRSDDRLLHECACPGAALICVDREGGN